MKDVRNDREGTLASSSSRSDATTVGVTAPLAKSTTSRSIGDDNFRERGWWEDDERDAIFRVCVCVRVYLVYDVVCTDEVTVVSRTPHTHTAAAQETGRVGRRVKGSGQGSRDVLFFSRCRQDERVRNFFTPRRNQQKSSQKAVLEALAPAVQHHHEERS